mgnify:CR=1 FL=1
MTVAMTQKNELAQFNPEQVALIKNYLCKGINDDELKQYYLWGVLSMEVNVMCDILREFFEENDMIWYL